MKQKQASETNSEVRRKTIEDDLAAFLAAGNKIEQVPSGISSQDPQGRSKPLSTGAPKPESAGAAKPESAEASEPTKTE